MALRLEVRCSETLFWALKGSIVALEGFGGCLQHLGGYSFGARVSGGPGHLAAITASAEEGGLLPSAAFAQAGYFQTVVELTSLTEDQQSRKFLL